MFFLSKVQSQKQPPEVFCKKSCSQKFPKTHRKIHGLQLYLKRLWHRYFHVSFAKFLRPSFLQNNSGDCFCSLFVTKLQDFQINISIIFGRAAFQKTFKNYWINQKQPYRSVLEQSCSSPQSTTSIKFSTFFKIISSQVKTYFPVLLLF